MIYCNLTCYITIFAETVNFDSLQYHWIIFGVTQLMLYVYVIVFPSSVSYLKANKTHLTGFCVVYIKTYVRSSKRKEKISLELYMCIFFVLDRVHTFCMNLVLIKYIIFLLFLINIFHVIAESNDKVYKISN